VRGGIDIIQLIGLPGELISRTKIKQDKSENQEINKILNYTLILHHRWAENRTNTQDHHNVVIINVGQNNNNIINSNLNYFLN
jgi:hypothetical protein